MLYSNCSIFMRSLLYTRISKKLWTSFSHSWLFLLFATEQKTYIEAEKLWIPNPYWITETLTVQRRVCGGCVCMCRHVTMVLITRDTVASQQEKGMGLGRHSGGTKTWSEVELTLCVSGVSFQEALKKITQLFLWEASLLVMNTSGINQRFQTRNSAWFT